jgi:20S proteasome alpha/beta subunit
MLSLQFNLNVEIIIAGIDKSKAHVSIIIHPGTIIPLDKLGYGAIGTGGIHAIMHLSLMGQTYQKELLETLCNVYFAKKASEVAPGVGQITDMAVIEEERIFYCNEPIMQELEKLHCELRERPAPDYNSLKGVYYEHNKPK